jgi:hypothetical protein
VEFIVCVGSDRVFNWPGYLSSKRHGYDYGNIGISEWNRLGSGYCARELGAV